MINANSRVGLALATICLLQSLPVLAVYHAGPEYPELLSRPIPTTGKAEKRFESLDKDFPEMLRYWDAPGGSITIAYKGNVVFSRGYGYADVKKLEPVQPDSIFRIASISKSFTATAIMKLVDEKRLSFDDKVFKIVDLKPFMANHKDPDPLLKGITIRHLLNCTAGWDRSKSGDPLFAPHVQQAAWEYSTNLRPNADAIIRSALSKKLDSIPGSHYAYSNLGYSILGKVIEKVSGKPYAEYVKEVVLQPLAMDHTLPGHTLKRAPKEVIYYPFGNQEQNTSVYPNVNGKVSLCYGGDFCLEAMTADSGWLSSTPDLVKFMNAVCQEGTAQRLISNESFAQIAIRPDVPEWKNSKMFFGMGFEVQPSSDPKANKLSRQGSLPGSTSVVVHRGDGWTWSVIANSRPADSEQFMRDIIKITWRAIDGKKK